MVKIILLTLGIVACLPAAPSVTVLGATSTQAVIGVSTAGTPSGCMIAVSESATMTPLVPDVDPAVVAGSNAATRIGNVVLASSVLFVAGRKFVDPISGKSLALHANAQHFARATCSDGTSGVVNFQTSNVPIANAFNEPLPAHPVTPGAFNWPTMSASNRGDTTIDPATGVKIMNFALPTDDSASTPGTNDSGMMPMCGEGLVTTSDGKVGYHCQVPNWDGYWNLYWVSASGDPPRLLGRMLTNATANHPKSNCTAQNAMTINQLNPNRFNCALSNGTVVVGTYIGHTNGHDLGLITAATDTLPDSTWVDVTPLARPLSTLMHEFDPTFDTTVFTTFNYGYTVDDGKLVGAALYLGQGRAGWFYVMDPARTAAQQAAALGSAIGCVDNPPVTGGTYTGAAGCIIALVNSWHGSAAATAVPGIGGGLRWSVIHSVGGYSLGPSNTWLYTSENNLSSCSFTITNVGGLPAAGSSGFCTMAQPGGNPITDWPNSSQHCDTITVDRQAPDCTDPVFEGVPAGTLMEVGDFFAPQDGPFWAHREVARILTITGGTTWYVQRKVTPVAMESFPQNTKMLTTASIFHMDRQANGEMWWNHAACPHSPCPVSAMSNDSVFFDGHVSFVRGANGKTFGSTVGLATQYVPPQSFTLGFANQITWRTQPYTNGVVILDGDESHPAYTETQSPGRNATTIIDGRPNIGGTTFLAPYTVTRATGNIYLLTGATLVTANLKLMPIVGHTFGLPLVDVSGVGSDVRTTQYTYCVPLAGGECYPGATVGQVYVNAPNVTSLQCNYRWISNPPVFGGDVCVIPWTALSGGITQVDISANAPLGDNGRLLTHGLEIYDWGGARTYWNARTIPNGKWAFTTFGWDGNLDNSFKLIEVPPFPTSAIAGLNYIPISVNATAQASSVTARVKFGNNPSFYCQGYPLSDTVWSGRREACVAVASSIQATPYYFASETYTPLACATTCTLAVPAMPQRVSYYQVEYLNGGGSVVATDPVQVVAVGNSPYMPWDRGQGATVSGATFSGRVSIQ